MAQHNETTAHVKGGMPVQVSGDVYPDAVENIRVCWASTGKPVTPKFLDSLSAGDWDAIAEAIAEA